MSNQVYLQNEELQGRVVQLRVDNEELRSMVSDHESSILELHLNNDMLTARLADAAADLGPDPSQQVRPVVPSHENDKHDPSLAVDSVYSCVPVGYAA